MTEEPKKEVEEAKEPQGQSLRKVRPKEDREWLKTVEDESWPDFVARMREAPHIKQANDLGTRMTIPATAYIIEAQSYVNSGDLDRKVRTESDLPKAVALMGVVQSYRERIASSQVGLIDMERNLKNAWKRCEAWIKLHPHMTGKKDGDRKSAVALILQELGESIDDIQSVLKAYESIIWTLKQAADTYNAQKQGLSTMISSGMRTGATPEHLTR